MGAPEPFHTDENYSLRHYLLWAFAVVIWILFLPAYIGIWLWRLITGQDLKARLWMFTGFK